MKQQELQKLKQKCIHFFKDIYKEEDKVLVFGEGNPDTTIVLVGEAPGEQETIQQRPFVGQAGKNLNEFLDVLQLRREDIYITNAVKFRPYKVNPDTGRRSNRPPNREELELNVSWLYKELEIIKPKILVSLGNTSLRSVTGDNGMNIGNVHGRPMKMVIPNTQIDCMLFPLYHPASIIYRKELKTIYMEDLAKLKSYLESIHT